MRAQVFKQKAFIPFVMSGYPTLQDTKEALYLLAKANADLIELGVPFSDPVADGVVNQIAKDVALQQGVHLESIVNLVHSMRAEGFITPVILFSYLNPILAYGVEAFAKQAVNAGIQGVLIVDLPPEEGESLYAQLKQNGLDIVLLISPTTNSNRFPLIKKLDPAFIYYISRCAVTGMQHALSLHLASELKRLKPCFPDHPIAVGFGISSKDQARQVALMADGVVVGSALVDTLGRHGLNAFYEQAQAFSNAIKIGVEHVD